jgi:glutaryl-CoA dehydrogenase
VNPDYYLLDELLTDEGADAGDILGGSGLLLENHVARHLTDMEVVYTYEGTDSMQSLIVGRAITGHSAFA